MRPPGLPTGRFPETRKGASLHAARFAARHPLPCGPTSTALRADNYCLAGRQLLPRETPLPLTLITHGEGMYRNAIHEEVGHNGLMVIQPRIARVARIGCDPDARQRIRVIRVIRGKNSYSPFFFEWLLIIQQRIRL